MRGSARSTSYSAARAGHARPASQVVGVPYGRIHAMPDLSASLDTAVLRKARGALFTPEPLARYVTEWAVRDVTDKVLEHACG